ncbi:cupin domain-containing protein [Thermosynechococcaceae cyanobacterium BACA0444]|uniref:Cupin domain-containing protein n=1 Tax=Pseudocalidococcus azoricus BACA0444 TaxID=2918990 RepID=A0AAE4FQS5_9CYAN|nr:cupin domain-containing protein [Pseudocalidococcus azoricus]MDS3860523.1 cupin domain-containing protein [Pseudocalidococcus azoricus BACA0444]
MNQSPISATSIPATQGQTIYPEPYASLVQGRLKRKLGDFFGLKNFGVNLTDLAPGAQSALLHHHSQQDEFIFILAGTPTLILGDRELTLGPGDCYGFPAGTGIAHQLVNPSAEPVRYLEIGDRSPNDQVNYPNDDLQASLTDGQWIITHKDGQLY